MTEPVGNGLHAYVRAQDGRARDVHRHRRIVNLGVSDGVRGR